MERLDYLPFYDLQTSFVLSSSLALPSIKRTTAVNRCIDLNRQLVIEPIRSDKSRNSTSNLLRSQHTSRQQQQHTTPRLSIKHCLSMPITSADDELPSIVSTMRRDSKDVGSQEDTTPRSSDIRSRPRRIDLDLPHKTAVTARLGTADSTAGDTRSSAADSTSVVPWSRSLPRRTAATAAAAAAAAAHSEDPDVMSTSVDDRGRVTSDDVTRRVGWSHDQHRQPQNLNSVDSQASKDSNDGTEDVGVSVPTTSSGRPLTSRCTGSAWQSRPSMPPRQATWTRQRRPTTTTRPATTPKSAKTTNAQVMSKSASHPSFLAMLVSGTAVTGRTEGPVVATARHYPTSRAANTRRADDNGATSGRDDERLRNRDNDNDNDNDDDEDDEQKRQRVEDWLQDLETVVLDRPPTPVIDEDVAPQTDTAIHIVYDGD